MKKIIKDVTKEQLLMLKNAISYDSETGIFSRKTGKMGVVKLCFSNTHGTVPVHNKTHKKYFTAWRTAVYAVYGYYPSYQDTVIFKDGDNRNLKIENIIVVRPSKDEQTIMDFSMEHNLSPQTVNIRMKKCERNSRMIRNGFVYFYKKKDFIEQCGDLIGRVRVFDHNDDKVIMQRPVNIDRQPRKNKMIRDFLAHWVGDMPTRWDMTLGY